ncbi:ABC transporter ATP-binding protein [Nonomuraea polychroma]|uniref:ABC transporter ATP-binding protein n=1 Tax=Nonomuraea polychroma TaxID=46176 RepID=UPI003D8A8BCF
MNSFTTLARPVRAKLLLGAALSFAGAAAGVLPFVAVAEIGRILLGAGQAADAWRWAGIGAAGALLRLTLVVAAGLITHYADADLQRHLRSRVARHTTRVPLGWLLGHGSGQLKKALHDDIDDLHHLIAHALNDVAGGIGLPLAAIVYLAGIDWRMMLVTLVPIPLALIAIKRAHRSLPERMAALTAAQRRINEATIEYADGIQVIKTYGRTGEANQRFSQAVEELSTALQRWSTDSAPAIYASRLLMSAPLFLLVICAGGLAMVAAGWLTPLHLLPFLLLGVSLPTPYTTIVQGTQHLRRARLAAAHLQQVLHAPVLPEPAAPARPPSYDVEFAQVSFSYDGHTPVLHEVSARCLAGTLTALVGPSGSGKTTLARLVPRFFDTTAGAVRIGSRDVRDLASHELLGSVAMVFQDVVLLRDTVRDNIRLARPQADQAEVEAAARAARLHEVITRLPRGYDTVLGEDGAGLSGGERQRLTIARAILQDAPIVVLDEATAFADPENEAAVQEALSELTAGRTVMVIAHRLHTITNADQILVLDGGHLVEHGCHDDLLAMGGTYARLWQAQETTLKETA